MKKVLITDVDKCTGCLCCEIVCSMTIAGEFNPSKSLIKILKNKDVDMYIIALNVKCNFCNECVKACLPGAIKFVEMEDAILNWKGVKVGSFPAPLINSNY